MYRVYNSMNCPVCGMNVESTRYQSSFHGHKYYFCCPDCKEEFEEHAAEYQE